MTESSAENDEQPGGDGHRARRSACCSPVTWSRRGRRRFWRAGADLRADVLKIPHHGSARQDPAFFAATGARLAIASAGLDNDYGHPAPRTVQLVRSLGMTVLRTDQQGSVAITSDDGRLAAVAQR